MHNVSRPLIALLVGTVAFFALWLFALKPPSPGSTSQPGVGSYQSAIDKAHHAVAIANRAPSAPAPKPTSTATPARASAAPAEPAPRAPTGASRVSPSTHRLNLVSRALATRKVLALLFFNPAAPDDRAVKQELGGIPLHHGQVVELAVPIGELDRYPVVTTQVPVDASPTLVVIAPDHEATTIVGFADRFEIGQRITDALTG